MGFPFFRLVYGFKRKNWEGPFSPSHSNFERTYRFGYQADPPPPLPPSRSNPYKSKPAPVNALGSKPSSSSATRKATSVSASKPPKKSPPPSAPPSSLPNSASSLCVADTGVLIWVCRIVCRRRRVASVGVLLLGYVLFNFSPIFLVLCGYKWGRCVALQNSKFLEGSYNY